MYTLDIHRIYKENEKDILSYDFSYSLKKKLDGKISSIEQVEDYKIFQIQRLCETKFSTQEKAELKAEIMNFRHCERELAKNTDEKLVVSHMLEVVRDYFISKFSYRFMKYIDTSNGDVTELSSLISNLSILEGRRALRVILRTLNCSEADIAFVMCNYAICRAQY
jgi:hypothetical protein